MKRILAGLFALALWCVPVAAQIVGGSSITVTGQGATPIIGGTNGLCLYDNNGKAGEQSCGGGTAVDITVGVTTVTGGATGRYLTDNAGVLGEGVFGSGVATALSNTAGGAGGFALFGATSNSVCTTTALSLQYNNAGAFGCVSGWTTDGANKLTGGASTSVAIGGATIGSNALAVTGTGLFNGALTNAAAGAASAPAMIFTGAIYAAGTGTTTFPHLFVQPTGATASTTWSTAGTAIGVNADAAFTGDLIAAKLGGATRFRVTSAGVIHLGTTFIANIDFSSSTFKFTDPTNATFVNMGFYGSDNTPKLYFSYATSTTDDGVHIVSGANYGWTSSSTNASGSPDTFIGRGGAAATVRLGAADVASGAIAQTLTCQGNTGAATTGPLCLFKAGVGGSGASVGGELRLQGGTPTAGTGGAITFYTSATTTPAVALTIGADKSLTSTGLLSLPVGTNSNPTINFGTANTGIYSSGGTTIDVTIGGVRNHIFASNGQYIILNATAQVLMGGLTSSFPMIKRSTTTLAVRLADDSADTKLTSGDFTASGANVIFTALGNTATTSAVCYNTGTGLITYNSTVGTCTVSTIRAKDLIGALTPRAGYDMVMAMEPIRYELKKDRPTYTPGEQIGFSAEQAATVDPRVVAMNADGTAGGFRYEQYTAGLTAAYKFMDAKLAAMQSANDNLRADNDNIRQEIEQLKQARR